MTVEPTWGFPGRVRFWTLLIFRVLYRGLGVDHPHIVDRHHTHTLIVLPDLIGDYGRQAVVANGGMHVTILVTTVSDNVSRIDG